MCGPLAPVQLQIYAAGNCLVIQYLFGVGRDPAANVPAATVRRGGDHHDTLHLCAGRIPRIVHHQLGIPVRVSWIQLTASLIFEPKHHFDYITFLAGLVQTGLYADFFYSTLPTTLTSSLL